MLKHAMVPRRSVCGTGRPAESRYRLQRCVTTHMYVLLSRALACAVGIGPARLPRRGMTARPTVPLSFCSGYGGCFLLGAS